MNTALIRSSGVSIAVLFYLAACSHTPTADDIPPDATFTTSILADNTKLFVYSQRFARGGAPREDYASPADRENTVRQRDAERTRAPLAAKNGVQAMLAQNHYCRAGYMVLEQYDQHGSYVIRGECRDEATAEDRNKFSSK
ncbi:MAG TPA: hypothetical protein VGK97_12800 [Spongiibacteraceae bacterium]